MFFDPPSDDEEPVQQKQQQQKKKPTQASKIVELNIRETLNALEPDTYIYSPAEVTQLFAEWTAANGDKAIIGKIREKLAPVRVWADRIQDFVRPFKGDRADFSLLMYPFAEGSFTPPADFDADDDVADKGRVVEIPFTMAHKHVEVKKYGKLWQNELLFKAPSYGSRRAPASEKQSMILTGIQHVGHRVLLGSHSLVGQIVTVPGVCEGDALSIDELDDNEQPSDDLTIGANGVIDLSSLDQCDKKELDNSAAVVCKRDATKQLVGLYDPDIEKPNSLDASDSEGLLHINNAKVYRAHITLAQYIATLKAELAACAGNKYISPVMRAIINKKISAQIAIAESYATDKPATDTLSAKLGGKPADLDKVFIDVHVYRIFSMVALLSEPSQTEAINVHAPLKGMTDAEWEKAESRAAYNLRFLHRTHNRAVISMAADVTWSPKLAVDMSFDLTVPLISDTVVILEKMRPEALVRLNAIPGKRSLDDENDEAAPDNDPAAAELSDTKSKKSGKAKTPAKEVAAAAKELIDESSTTATATSVKSVLKDMKTKTVSWPKPDEAEPAATPPVSPKAAPVSPKAAPTRVSGNKRKAPETPTVDEQTGEEWLADLCDDVLHIAPTPKSGTEEWTGGEHGAFVLSKMINYMRGNSDKQLTDEQRFNIFASADESTMQAKMPRELGLAMKTVYHFFEYTGRGDLLLRLEEAEADRAECAKKRAREQKRARKQKPVEPPVVEEEAEEAEDEEEIGF